MVSPKNPGVKGNSETIHDGMDDAGHEAQFKHADKGSSINEEDKHEGSSESEKNDD